MNFMKHLFLAPVAARCCWLFVLIGAFGPLTGCEYSMGTQHLYDTQYHTVNVPIFENRTLTRGVQHDLTEALIKEISTRTPYAIGGTGSSDTVIQGVVTDVERQMISRGKLGNVPQQLEITLRVDFEWRDLRTGKVIRGRQGFEAVGSYLPRAPVYETEDVAIQMAVSRIAEDMVQAMQADWTPGGPRG